MHLLSFVRKSYICRVPVTLLMLFLLILPPGLMPAQSPTWWQARGVLKSDNSLSDDYAVINQGQLKNLAKAAVLELDSTLSGGAGDALHQMITAWANPTEQTDDYAAVNLGQLKAVATPVYDRLMAIGYVAEYPWVTGDYVVDDYALANIGQAKNLFAFDISTDTNSVGIPDWWQTKYGLHFTSPEDALALAPGGVTYQQKYELGLNPLLADSDGDGVNDGTEIQTGSDPGDKSSTPPPLVALTTSESVEAGDQVTIQLTASGGVGGNTFMITQPDPDLETVGTLGSLNSDGIVIFTANEDATHDTWFDYQVMDADGSIATETVSISVSVVRVAFECRMLKVENIGGGYDVMYETRTRNGDWDISSLSEDQTLNTILPEWSGWRETITTRSGEGGGYGYPFDPSQSPSKQQFVAEPIVDGWYREMGSTISVNSFLNTQYYPSGVSITHPFANPSTIYPYADTDAQNIVTYRLPNEENEETNALSDFQEKMTVTSSGYISEWEAIKAEIRMVRVSGSNSRQIQRTVTKTRVDVDGVTTTEDVTFTIAAGQNESHTVASLLAYVAATGPSKTMSETMELPTYGPAIGINSLDRDNPNAPWSQNEPLRPGKPLYSGKGNRDMTEFFCFEQSSNDFMTWEAEGPVFIQGPIWTKDIWSIREGTGEEGAPTSVRWKPGTYTIRCWIFPANKPPIKVERKVRVGFRTDDFVIVGQIVPTTTHSLLDARQQIVKKTLIQDVTLLDIAYTVVASKMPPHGLTPPYPRDTLIAQTPAKAIALAWAGWYALRPRTTKVLPVLDGNEKAWLIQTLLNSAPDAAAQRLPDDDFPFSKTEAELNVLYASKQYRIYEQYQAKGLIAASGKMEGLRTVTPIIRMTIGPTKYPGSDKGALWDFVVDGVRYQSPAISAGFTEAPETPSNHLLNATHTNATSRSLYAAGRIGERGRKVHWHLLGKDAPWIFGEIQFNSKGAGEFPDSKVYTSMHKTVTPVEDDAPATDEGDHPFNNLSVFRRNVKEVDKPYRRIKFMQMQGQVQPFIESGSTTWGAQPEQPPHTN